MIIPGLAVNMSTSRILITGANGEIGHSLIEQITRENAEAQIVAVDLREPNPALAARCSEFIVGDITDPALVERLQSVDLDVVFHLAALLSTGAERNPVLAHNVNVNGTLALLEMAHATGIRQKKPVVFMYPSSIAVYGLPSLEVKQEAGVIDESAFTEPITMYGINKLYTEQLGRYFTKYFKLLEGEEQQRMVDFRALRFPGLISAFTIPHGGTSDFGPEMIHAAARNEVLDLDESYSCFVRPDARIPFMAMPDAIKALRQLAAAPAANLTQTAYNITSFAPSAAEFADMTAKQFPRSKVDYTPHKQRQAIIDSWPEDTDDSRARRDWNWTPEYDFARCFVEYLVPNIVAHYRKQATADQNG